MEELYQEWLAWYGLDDTSENVMLFVNYIADMREEMRAA